VPEVLPNSLALTCGAKLPAGSFRSLVFVLPVRDTALLCRSWNGKGVVTCFFTCRQPHLGQCQAVFHRTTLDNLIWAHSRLGTRNQCHNLEGIHTVLFPCCSVCAALVCRRVFPSRALRGVRALVAVSLLTTIIGWSPTPACAQRCVVNFKRVRYASSKLYSSPVRPPVRESICKRDFPTAYFGFLGPVLP
jgi:hypothetical protein